jgi:hypothetical protein
MNPTLPEEAGATARGLIEALKAQPAVLALTVANMALLVFIFFALKSSAETRGELVGQILQNSTAIHALLQQRAVSCPDARTN